VISKPSSPGKAPALGSGVQMVFAAVAGREMWAAKGETPLITACPSANAKTSEKRPTVP